MKLLHRVLLVIEIIMYDKIHVCLLQTVCNYVQMYLYVDKDMCRVIDVPCLN